MSRPALAIPLTVLLALPITAARAELKVGDAAPPLKVAKWTKGDPVILAEGKGKKIHVVEFWATWCGPCIRGIPHLTRMAARFENKDVVVVGVSIDDEKTRDDVEPFVKSMGKRMGYTVALDESGKTSAAYLEAAGVDGIPYAFIVGKDGNIAWHGHPMEGLGRRVAEMVGDKEFAEEEKKLEELRRTLGTVINDEKWPEALAAIDKLLILDPEEAGLRILKYQILSVKTKEAAAASRWGDEVVQKSEESAALNALAWNILTAEGVEAGERDLKLALKAAKKANDLSKGESWEVLDTYARALFETGDAKQAVELQAKALEIARREKAEQGALDVLSEALERFKKGTSKEEKKEGEKGGDEPGKP